MIYNNFLPSRRLPFYSVNCSIISFAGYLKYFLVLQVYNHTENVVLSLLNCKKEEKEEPVAADFHERSRHKLGWHDLVSERAVREWKGQRKWSFLSQPHESFTHLSNIC